MSKRRNLRRTARNTRQTAINTAATARAVQQQTAMESARWHQEQSYRYDTDPQFRAWTDEQRALAAERAELARMQRENRVRRLTFRKPLPLPGEVPPRPAPKQLTGPTSCAAGCGTYLYPGDAFCPKCGALPPAR